VCICWTLKCLRWKRIFSSNSLLHRVTESEFTLRYVGKESSKIRAFVNTKIIIIVNHVPTIKTSIFYHCENKIFDKMTSETYDAKDSGSLLQFSKDLQAS
jgi:hypothetical protein